jgi:hypothetical protein
VRIDDRAFLPALVARKPGEEGVQRITGELTCDATSIERSNLPEGSIVAVDRN